MRALIRSLIADRAGATAIEYALIAVMLSLVAIAGFALYFGLDRTDRSRHIFGTLLGIGLLFLGLETLKAGAVPIREMLMGGGLLATLAASASYIAVPAAMRIAVPEANHGVAIAASLGVTFPFNVAVGIALYTEVAQRWIG